MTNSENNSHMIPYVQDWLTWKVIRLTDYPKSLITKRWDKLMFEINRIKYVGTYIGHNCEAITEWKFLLKMENNQLKTFYNYDKEAKEIYSTWKTKIKEIIPEIIPITGKMNFDKSIIYLYFFSETRHDFRQVLNDIKEIVWMKFFLFQIWARDRIRFSSKSENYIWSCWLKLCCTRQLCKIKSVETDSIGLQNLETQWIEKNKWICGKLKCCLIYEKNVYESEIKKYPEKWSMIKIEDKEFTVLGYNIISETLFLKDSDWNVSVDLIHKLKK